jgi:16S rRNA G966 N2-methylase RsmD
MGNVRKPRILDAFACVGGNTIAFLEYYNDITAIELDCDRFKMLVYNMNLIYDFAPVPNRLSEFYINSSSSDRMDEYVDSSAISRDVSFKKVRFLCQDSTQHNEKYDVIFADPPWNGNEKDNTITIGELTLLEYIRDKSAELYVVKVPFNYISDFEKLEDEFAVFSETYDHPNRMKIIYIKKKYDIDCY